MKIALTRLTLNSQLQGGEQQGSKGTTNRGQRFSGSVSASVVHVRPKLESLSN